KGGCPAGRGGNSTSRDEACKRDSEAGGALPAPRPPSALAHGGLETHHGFRDRLGEALAVGGVVDQLGLARIRHEAALEKDAGLVDSAQHVEAGTLDAA